MRAIFGIGNPGQEYEDTRHNVGFSILDRFAEKHSLTFRPSKGDYYFAGGALNATHFLLIKPTTYVNNCGIAALQLIQENNLDIENFLVVTDDVNLKLGKIRIRKSGGDGGHNGISSIIYHLNSDEFPRLRFGIGNDFEKGKMADYVLEKLDEVTLTSLETNFNFSIDLTEEFIKNGIQEMLNYFSKNVVFSADDLDNSNEFVDKERG